jgi:hypothetical protein
VSQRIQPETGVVLALEASTPMAFGRLDIGKPRLHGCIGRRKLAKSGAPNADSTGNTNLAQSRPNLPKSYRQYFIDSQLAGLYIDDGRNASFHRDGA